MKYVCEQYKDEHIFFKIFLLINSPWTMVFYATSHPQTVKYNSLEINGLAIT